LGESIEALADAGLGAFVLVNEDRDDLAQFVIDELMLMPLATELAGVAFSQCGERGCGEIPTLLYQVVGSLDLFVADSRLLVF
jgi:hypothetical protein